MNLSLQLCVPCSGLSWPVASSPQAASKVKAWLSDPVLVYFCTPVPSGFTGYTFCTLHLELGTFFVAEATFSTSGVGILSDSSYVNVMGTDGC